jgi:hypothetical protein
MDRFAIRNTFLWPKQLEITQHSCDAIRFSCNALRNAAQIPTIEHLHHHFHYQLFHQTGIFHIHQSNANAF